MVWVGEYVSASTGGTPKFRLIHWNDDFEIDFGTGSGQIGFPANDTAPHTILFTKTQGSSNNTIKLYVDGVLRKSPTNTAGSGFTGPINMSSTTTLKILNHGGNGAWSSGYGSSLSGNGSGYKLSNLRIWDKEINNPSTNILKINIKAPSMGI